MKVKIFYAGGTENLELKINEFLDQNQSIEIIKIDYQISHPYNYSALILFKQSI